MRTSMTTVEYCLKRLPMIPLVVPVDISTALGLATTQTILRSISDGSLSAIKVGRNYKIARTEAERFIRSLAASSDQENAAA